MSLRCRYGLAETWNNRQFQKISKHNQPAKHLHGDLVQMLRAVMQVNSDKS